MSDIKKVSKVEKLARTENISKKRARANRQFNLSRQEFDFDKIEDRTKLEDTSPKTLKASKGDRITISSLSKDLSFILDSLEDELLEIEVNTNEIRKFIDYSEDLEGKLADSLKSLDQLELELLSSQEEAKETAELDRLILDGDVVTEEKLTSKDLMTQERLDGIKGQLKESLKADIADARDLLRDIAKDNPELFRNPEKYSQENKNPNIAIRTDLISNIRKEIVKLEEVIRLLDNIDFKSQDKNMTRLEFNNKIKENLDRLKYILTTNTLRLSSEGDLLDRLLQRSIDEEIKVRNNEIYKNFNQDNIHDKENPYYRAFLGSGEIEKLKKRELDRIRNKQIDIKREGRRDIVPGLLNIFNNLDNRSRDIFFIVLGFIMAVIIIIVIF